MAWMRPSNALSAGNGHTRSPLTPTTALSARLITNRYSTRRCIGARLPNVVHRRTSDAFTMMPVRLRNGFGGLLIAPRDEFPIPRERVIDQLVEHVIGRVAD